VKVIVTGGAGFIGKHLVKTLLRDEKCNVVVIDNLSNSNLKTFYEFLSWPKYDISEGDRLSFHEVDIRNDDAVQKVFEEEGDIDTCIHLAAISSVSDSSLDPNSTFSTNVEGTRNVLSSSSEVGIRNFVYASSAAIYGQPRHLPIREEDPAEPISEYGKSKLLGEQLVDKYSSKYRTVTSLRIFNVYGRQTMGYAGVITRFADQISKGLPLVIYGNGDQTRDFVSVEDVVGSIILAGGINEELDNDNNKHSIWNRSQRRLSNQWIMRQNVFNIGTGMPTTIMNLAKLMIKMSGNTSYHVEPVYQNILETDILESYADMRRSRLVLGFNARVDLNLGIERIFSATCTDMPKIRS
jgi:UDP-glucose 4-epimerase